MKIVIAEKPSVARDLARVLGANSRKDGYIEGNGYQITWAFGHLVRLIDPDDYDESFKKWRLDDLPIMPDDFKTAAVENDGSKRQLSLICKLLTSQSANEVICATDAGREGELIFRLIYQASGCALPIKRLWISSQTDAAIKDGFANLHAGESYQPLYDSALCRAQADWLIGMNATRAYTVSCSRGAGVLSVGRVQTPVLKMIVDRYLEHTQFEPKTFYELVANVVHPNGSYIGRWTGNKEGRLFDEAEAKALLESAQKTPDGVIEKVTQKQKKEKQPLLYDLTELQRDANKSFKFSADETLKIVQSLYETHKVVTYPRTSSRYLSQDMVPKLKGLVQNLAEMEDYAPFANDILKTKLPVTKRIVDDKKVTDHHALIPTEKKANLAQFSPDEKKVYDLIMRRFLSVFLPECVKDLTEIITMFGPHPFRTSGMVIKSAGWRAVYLGDTHAKGESLLPQVQKGDAVQSDPFELVEGQTKPPPLYNEASILSAMETAGKHIDDEELRDAMKECGLGTPATRAQILERLIAVKYVVRDKNRFIPTSKGQQIIQVIQDPALVSPELTGQFEKKLNDMAQGHFNRSDYMTEIRSFTEQIVGNIQKVSHQVAITDRKSVGECPKCKAPVFELKLSYSCSKWKETGCDFVIWKAMAGKQLSETQVKTLLKDGKTKVIKGFKNRSGQKFDAALVLENGKTSFAFSRESLGACPICSEGEVVETPKAYSCSKWRETQCSFAVWKEMAKKKIGMDVAKALLKDGKTEVLSGFKSRAGKEFDAALKLNDDGKVVFEFNS